jgi:hypothetical protein
MAGDGKPSGPESRTAAQQTALEPLDRPAGEADHVVMVSRLRQFVPRSSVAEVD